MDIGTAVEQIKARKKKYRLLLIGSIIFVVLAYASYPLYAWAMATGYHIAATNTKDPIDAATLETHSQIYLHPKQTAQEMKFSVEFESLSPLTYDKKWCSQFLTKSSETNPESTLIEDIRVERMACKYVEGEKREAMDEARLYADEVGSKTTKKAVYEFGREGRAFAYLTLVYWAASKSRYELADDLIIESNGYYLGYGYGKNTEVKDLLNPQYLLKMNSNKLESRKRLCRHKNNGLISYLCFKEGLIKQSELPTPDTIRASWKDIKEN